MAGKTRRAARSERARGLRTLQHQRLPRSTCQGIETEVWLRQLLADTNAAASIGRDAATKDQVQDDALSWFLDQHAVVAPPQYPARRADDEDVTFWIDARLLQRARRMADRDGVRVARLLDAAFSGFVEQCVGAATLQFRQQVGRDAARLQAARVAAAARKSRR